ncbi:hypothetical protein [Psychroserpens sp.]|uniref:hypothetical protein n=1 Tax=Psychroserpens sp. TaxID=2020870 RepID=UPI003859CD67
MKLSKFIFLTFLSITLFNCGSDDSSDDGDDTPQPQVIVPTITLDVAEAILRTPGSDITDLVDFGQPNGVDTSEYLVELSIGDIYNPGQPQNLATGEMLYYSNYTYFEENPLDPGVYDQFIDGEDLLGVYFNAVFPESTVSPATIEDPFSPTDDVWESLGLEIIDADDDDIDWKYDLEVLIVKDGTAYGYYTIDPKLRIKGRNTNSLN